jgi:hypothetical protein
MCSIYHGAVIYVSDRLGGEFLSLFFGFLCLTRARRHDPRSGSKTFRRKKENVFHQQRERGSPVYDLDLYHSRTVQQRLYRKKNAKQKRRRRRRVGPIDPSTPPTVENPCMRMMFQHVVRSDETVSEKNIHKGGRHSLSLIAF